MLVVLGTFVYLLLTVLIGFWASRRVKNASDFLLAGRRLPLYISGAALFATWFGAETVLGASSAMAEHGLLGAIEDPFGAALCLLLIGIFFARPLYRMNLYTFADFYRNRYGKAAEWLASIFLIISYFGWIAAQMVALGLIANLFFGIDMIYGVLIGSAIVVAYTVFGGMWSVSILDFVQNIVIIVGLTWATIEAIQNFDELSTIREKLPADYFNFFPKANPKDWLNYFAAWITIGLGSIPQQDIFQRVMSAKDEKTAVRAAYLGTFLYVTVALLPLILATYMKAYHAEYLKGDAQYAIPLFIMKYTSPFVQLLFFGALLSAIMSTASGTILAPAAVLSENVFRNIAPQFTEKRLLLVSRLCVIIIALISLVMALSRTNIYELVGESSALSLVSLFAPMAAGIYWKRANGIGALASMIGGMGVWLIAVMLKTEVNALIYGFGASIILLILGSLLFKPRTVNLP